MLHITFLFKSFKLWIRTCRLFGSITMLVRTTNWLIISKQKLLNHHRYRAIYNVLPCGFSLLTKRHSYSVKKDNVENAYLNYFECTNTSVLHFIVGKQTRVAFDLWKKNYTKEIGIVKEYRLFKRTLYNIYFTLTITIINNGHNFFCNLESIFWGKIFG